MMSNLTELNDGNFRDFINMRQKVVVDFWAPWCGPCIKMSPILDELDSEMNDVSFAKLNVDENQDVSSEFEINAIPTLIVFKGGRKVGEITGFKPKESLKKSIESFF